MNLKQIKANAKNAFLANYWICVGVFALISIILGVAGYTFIGAVIIGGPLMLGATIFSLNLLRTGKATFDDAFKGFEDFGRSLVAYLLVALYTFLWSLLFIIPGIIKGLSYSQTFEILRDNKDITPSEAIKKSQEMMNGYKAELFILQLSFIGWIILSAFTFGILLIFYVSPYMELANREFYIELKKIKEPKNDDNVIDAEPIVNAPNVDY